MNNLLSRVALASMLMGASVMAMAATVAPEGAKVSILSPADGATVDKTFTVKFRWENSIPNSKKKSSPHLFKLGCNIFYPPTFKRRWILYSYRLQEKSTF